MSGFREQIVGIPEQLDREPDLRAGSLPVEGRLLLGGLGGSAAAADLLSLYLDDRRETLVVREGSLPRRTRPDDVVLVVSYSGATAESVALWEEAHARGLKGGVVASGGPLLQAAAAAQVPRALLPTGLAPRAALGYLVRGAWGLAGADTLFPWEEAARHLKEVRTVWGEGAQGAALAAALQTGLPIVLAGDGPSIVAARRWVADLAENAKMPAVLWELPEAAHNRIMAAAREASGSIPLVLVAVGSPQEERALAYWESALALLEEHGAVVHRADHPHPDPWIHALGLAYLGDWVSLLVAEGKGADIESLSLMNELKARLASGKGKPSR